MEYERIHKGQLNAISPTRIRMKLLGTQASKKKEGGSVSSRASSSPRLRGFDGVKDSLLGSDDDDVHDREDINNDDSQGSCVLDAAAPIVEDSSVTPKLDLPIMQLLGYKQGSHANPQPKNSSFKGNSANHGLPRDAQRQIQGSGSNSSTVHPVRPLEEANGYDSGYDNGSTSSFEFHQGDRPPAPVATAAAAAAAPPFFRHVPSKWNDAEKWLVNKQALNSSNPLKRAAMHNQGATSMVPNPARAAAAAPPISVADKFSFVPQCSQHPAKPIVEPTVVPTTQATTMRDIGTEMTPIPSQDPSRTGTPDGAASPMHSPGSSMPSTPKRSAPAPSPVEAITDDEMDIVEKTNKGALSARELQLKTRREIVALGIKLGKMNIASWASKEMEHAAAPLQTSKHERHVKTENETRAVAWEETQKCKNIARHKHEEVKIQAWERLQKAKYETKMRAIEAQAEQMKARAQEEMVEKLAVARRRAVEKQVTAEVRKSRRAARTARKADRIRRTGRVPSSAIGCCSSLLLF